jgi:MFS family permease
VRGRSGAWIAVATLAVYWGLAGAGFLLRLGNDPALDVPDQLVQRVIWGGWPTIGAVIVARRPRNQIGWLCCAVGFLVGPAFFAQDYAWYALVHRPGSLPGGLAMGWFGNWPWFIALVLILVFVPLLFPNGQLASQRWRPVAWAAAAWLVPVWVATAFSPGPLEGTRIETVPNPLGIQGAEAAFKLLEPIAALGVGLLMLLSVASMVVRFRRARGAVRQQLKWFTYAAVLSVLLFLGFVLTGLDSRTPSPLGYVIAALWLMAIPVAIGVALLRYHLFDIDRLINRTLVYGLLTAILGLCYVAGSLVFVLVAGAATDPPSWLVAAATLAAAAVVRPARRRVQAVVDRRFNRQRYDAAKTIEAFSGRLREQLDLDTLSAELLAVVNQTMQPTKASLWLRPPTRAPQDHGASVAHRPAARPDPLRSGRRPVYGNRARQHAPTMPQGGGEDAEGREGKHSHWA